MAASEIPNMYPCSNDNTSNNKAGVLATNHLLFSEEKCSQTAFTFLKNALSKFPNLVIDDIDAVQQKLAGMIQKGAQHVHMISDFDMTMTQQWVNGKRGITTHGVLAKYPRFPDSFRESVKAMYEKYYPIEIDPNIPLSKKYIFMEEWWVKSHDTILEAKISQEDLEEMAKQFELVWRPQLDTLLKKLHFLTIPFLVFSAGLEDLIYPILRHANLLFPNMNVLSNRMAFNESGVATCFIPPVIHTLNKREIHIQEYLPHYQGIQCVRKNVIVMGDSLGDAAMAQGIEHDIVLKIGFYNLHENGNLDKYKANFDIVLINDTGFDFVLELVDCLGGAS